MDNLIKLISDYSKLSKEDQELFITILTRHSVIEKKVAMDTLKKALEEQTNKVKQRPTYKKDIHLCPFYPGSPFTDQCVILPYIDPLKRQYDIICNTNSNIRGNFES